MENGNAGLKLENIMHDLADKYFPDFEMEWQNVREHMYFDENGKLLFEPMDKISEDE